jgi:pimeloyl-ACP methyl ester carboxylesterase
VIPELTARGHQADAIDLPGHGADQTQRDTVRMADYVASVREHLVPETILVGHSFGGFPITLAAAEAPDQVRALVYLCALLPRPGQAFTALRPEAISPDVSGAQVADRDAGVSRPLPEKSGPVFYSDCAQADRDWALPQLTPQPIAVMTETVDFDPPATPRHYIRCLEDRVVFPRYQQEASRDWPYTYDMQAGHSPFLSDPEGLADILDRIAAT